MTTDSFFVVACGTMIALLFGLAVTFGGYRLFMLLLPIWGFVFGLALGAQTVQAIFGVGFLSTVTSWVVGFIVGGIFAVLSYLFYIFAVALIAGSLGYSLGTGLMLLIGLEMNLITWLIGIVVAVALIVVTLRFNLAKWLIIIGTSFLGAGVIVGTFLAMFGGLPPEELVANPVKAAMQNSPFWMITFIILGIIGLVVQIGANRRYTAQPWENRI